MIQDPWPALPYDEWKDTCDTLHMWMQIVGKVSLALKPFLNQYWQVAFPLTARGMTTGLIPHEQGAFEFRFDFVDHQLRIETTGGSIRTIPLRPRSVASFYEICMAELAELGIEAVIDPMPTEVPDPVACDADTLHASYDPEYVNRWWRIQVEIANVLQRFRADFVGKSSPIQFFWGSFDLSYTRFSGRPAPALTGVPEFFRLSENQENFACGFWPGNPNVSGVTLAEPAFYAYIVPAPEAFRNAEIEPREARFEPRLGEFILPYELARTGYAPDERVLLFFQTAYQAAASLAGWDRAALESTPPSSPNANSSR